jgi:hypothetical protein
MCVPVLVEFSSRSNVLSATLIAEGALRAGPDANPPLNMRGALIFRGSFIFATSSTVFFLRGNQARKELDERKEQQALAGGSPNVE